MITRKAIPVILFAAAILATGCQKEKKDKGGNENIIIPVEMEFALNVESMGSVVESRTNQGGGDGAAALEITYNQQPDTKAVNEEKITWLGALQFDGTGDNATLCIAPSIIDDPNGIDLSKVKFVLNDKGDAQQTVILVANPTPVILASFNNNRITVGKTLEAVRRELLLDFSATQLIDGSIQMGGQYVGKVNKSLKGDVLLKRALAKLTFTWDASAFNVPGMTFTIMDVQVLNGCSQITTIETTEGSTMGYTWTDNKVLSVTGLAKGSFTTYLNENVRGYNHSIDELNKTGVNAPDEKGTFVQIAGIVHETATGKTRLVLERLYLGGSTAEYAVRRNTHYNMSVKLLGINRLDKRIFVETDGDANCFMVAPGGNLLFDATVQPAAYAAQFALDVDDYIGLADGLSYNKDENPLWQTGDGTKPLAIVNPYLYDGKYMSVETNPYYATPRAFNTHGRTAVGGNALIRIFRRTDDFPIWSWHLWVTDYQVGSEGSTATGGSLQRYSGDIWDNTYAGKYVMDRNLGALSTKHDITSWGLYYQWGRKDPFGSAESGHRGTNHPGGNYTEGRKRLPVYYQNGVTPYNLVPNYDPLMYPDQTEYFLAYDIIEDIGYESTPNTLQYSIYHPMTFIKARQIALPDGSGASNRLYDWYAWGWQRDEQNDTLWIHSDGRKTIFDPCPKGYSVPRMVYDGGNRTSIWDDYWKNNSTVETFSQTNDYNDGANDISGIFYHNFAWYPYADCLPSTNGYIGTAITQRSFMWSSSISHGSNPQEANGWTMKSDGSAYVSTRSRGTGGQVRCIQQSSL